MGMEMTLQTRGSETSVLVLRDPDERKKFTVVISPSGGDTAVNVTYGRKR